MGFYGDLVLPYCVDLACGVKALMPERAKACEGLFGRVLEIGFGSGLNIPYYPESVVEVRGVDPSVRALGIARERLGAAKCKIEAVGVDAQRIAIEDGWADAALSTFTLCTIPDVSAALLEVRRILKPGGSLHFLEHGRAPDAKVARLQDRLNAMQGFIAGGCNLNREMKTLIEAAGFTISVLHAGYLPRSPRTHGYLYRGIATRS